MFEDIYSNDENNGPDLEWDYTGMTKDERTHRALNILKGKVEVRGKKFWEHEIFRDNPRAIVKSLEDFIDFIENGFK